MEINTKQTVFDAIVELKNSSLTVTRESIAELTGLPLTTVDDRVKILINDGLVGRERRGVYYPIPQHELSRFISVSETPDGLVIIDVGDEVLKLTPREARMVATMLAGRANQATLIALTDKVNEMTDRVDIRLRNIEKSLFD